MSRHGVTNRAYIIRTPVSECHRDHVYGDVIKDGFIQFKLDEYIQKIPVKLANAEQSRVKPS